VAPNSFARALPATSETAGWTSRRSTVLSSLVDKLRFLKHGLVGVLGLVGTKMVVAAWWPAPAWLSLALVTLILGGAIVASLVSPASTPNPDRIPNAERS